MEKTLEQWKEEIDAGIAKGRADFKAGNFYILDDSFINNIKKEVKKEKLKSKKKDFLFSNKSEGILV